ncbi:MAG: putative signal transducing protein [Salinibacter sp.]
MPEDRLVTVARYDAQGDARLAQTQLEDAGIPCMLANTTQSGLAPMFDAAEGGVQVKVTADRADEARDVLNRTD